MRLEEEVRKDEDKAGPWKSPGGYETWKNGNAVEPNGATRGKTIRPPSGLIKRGVAGWETTKRAWGAGSQINTSCELGGDSQKKDTVAWEAGGEPSGSEWPVRVRGTTPLEKKHLGPTTGRKKNAYNRNWGGGKTRTKKPKKRGGRWGVRPPKKMRTWGKKPNRATINATKFSWGNLRWVGYGEHDHREAHVGVGVLADG